MEEASWRKLQKSHNYLNQRNRGVDRVKVFLASQEKTVGKDQTDLDTWAGVT